MHREKMILQHTFSWDRVSENGILVPWPTLLTEGEAVLWGFRSVWIIVPIQAFWIKSSLIYINKFNSELLPWGI